MRFFDKLAETSTSRNRLTHWSQVGATYFVTFRLADSIPRERITEWKARREDWLLQHPQPWDSETEAAYHKLFSSEIDRLMDAGSGSCALRDPTIRLRVEQSFSRFDGARYAMHHSSVVMPNHVHLLITPGERRPLQGIVRDWKCFTGREINGMLGSRGRPFWQKDYFDRLIRDWDHFFRVAGYIRRNPAKAKLRGHEFTLSESELVKRMLS